MVSNFSLLAVVGLFGLRTRRCFGLRGLNSASSISSPESLATVLMGLLSLPNITNRPGLRLGRSDFFDSAGCETSSGSTVGIRKYPFFFVLILTNDQIGKLRRRLRHSGQGPLLEWLFLNHACFPCHVTYAYIPAHFCRVFLSPSLVVCIQVRSGDSPYGRLSIKYFLPRNPIVLSKAVSGEIFARCAWHAYLAS